MTRSQKVSIRVLPKPQSGAGEFNRFPHCGAATQLRHDERDTHLTLIAAQAVEGEEGVWRVYRAAAHSSGIKRDDAERNAAPRAILRDRRHGDVGCSARPGPQIEVQVREGVESRGL